MNAVQCRGSRSLSHGGPFHPEFTQLLHRNQAILALGQSRNLPIPSDRGSPPTGRKRNSGSRFRPIGGLLLLL
jgi:hypothetical protein